MDITQGETCSPAKSDGDSSDTREPPNKKLHSSDGPDSPIAITNQNKKNATATKGPNKKRKKKEDKSEAKQSVKRNEHSKEYMKSTNKGGETLECDKAMSKPPVKRKASQDQQDKPSPPKQQKITTKLPSKIGYSAPKGQLEDSSWTEHKRSVPLDTSLRGLVFGTAGSSSLGGEDEEVKIEVKGSNVPQPANTFEDLKLSKMMRILLRYMQYKRPTPVQSHTMAIISARRDLMAILPIASLQTSSYLVPIIDHVYQLPLPKSLKSSNPDYPTTHYPSVVVLATSRKHLTHINSQVKMFTSRLEMNVVCVHSEGDVMTVAPELSEGCHLLITQPNRLVEMIKRGILGLDSCRHLVVEGLETMIRVGFDNRLNRILRHPTLPPPGECQTVLISSTYTKEIQWLAEDYLDDFIFLSAGREESAVEVLHKVIRVNKEHKCSFLLDVLDAAGFKDPKKSGNNVLTLILLEKKADVNSLDVLLRHNGFPVISIHGDRHPRERDDAVRLFCAGQLPIMIATMMSLRGHALPPIVHVINYDLPKSIERYKNSIEYAGEVGRTGLATTFFSECHSGFLLRDLVLTLKSFKQEVPPWLSTMAADAQQNISELRKAAF